MMRLTEQETEFLDKVFPLFRQLPEQKQQEVKTAMEELAPFYRYVCNVK